MIAPYSSLLPVIICFLLPPQSAGIASPIRPILTNLPPFSATGTSASRCMKTPQGLSGGSVGSIRSSPPLEGWVVVPDARELYINYVEQETFPQVLVFRKGELVKRSVGTIPEVKKELVDFLLEQ